MADRRSVRDDRVLQTGLLVGAAIGAAVTVLGRRAEKHARQGLVDWPAVERSAAARARRAPGRLSPEELRASQAAYDEAMRRVVPALGAALGTELPGVVDRVGVVDRAGWISANISGFATIMSRLEGPLLEQLVPPDAGLGAAAMALANRWLTTRQLGLLLGFMAGRVLGQYDLAILTAETTPGRLLFVEENIRQTARSLDVPLDDFRTWIALHETTHAFEFEAHPWLRPYLAERLEAQLAAFSRDVPALGRETMQRLGAWLRGEGSGSWIERLMGPEQAKAFRETQAVMSLLEGFGDHVMDEVGRTMIPGVERISARFHERRERRSGMDRAILRLTGMDLKLEQYKRGERFVAAIAAARGQEALQRLWEGPQTLPLPEEIDAPERWIARVLDAPAALPA